MAVRSAVMRRLAGAGVFAAVAALALGGAASPGVRAAAPAFAAPAVSSVHAQSAAPAAQKPAASPPAKKDPLAKLKEPWPDAVQLAESRREAEGRPLFASAEPLAITLTADFTSLNRERGETSTTRYPGTMQWQGEDGRPMSVPVQFSARGHARRNVMVCSVVPLRLEFAKAEVKGTVFDGQKELKLVTHCENQRYYEQYVLSEYLAYRLYGLFTPNSFRVRLVRATYVDPARNRSAAVHYGMLVENEDDLARRLEGRVADVPNRIFRMFDRDALTWMFLVQFLVGNTDYSILALHNIKVVVDPRETLYPIGYDFDYSGLVNARYAIADKRLNIYTVRDRLYRGPCRPAADFEPYLAAIRAKGPDMLALVDGVPDMTPATREYARKYLNEFLSLVADPRRIQRELTKGCVSGAGM